jgi:hypothetical protein
MKTNKEILDQFGKYVGSDAFDSSYGSMIEILNATCPNQMMQDKVELFSRFSSEEKKIIKEYIYDLTSGTIFDFLRIFEEHPEFKIVYEENGQQVDLNKISEMLKAEPIIDNGWIARFSKELNNETTS